MFESGAPTDIDEPELVWRFFNERHYLLLVPNRLAHSGPGALVRWVFGGSSLLSTKNDQLFRRTV